MSLWRSSAEPVGVKNSDQELDLRLRKAARRRASTFSGRYGREHRAFGCLAWGRGHCGAPRAGPECVRLSLIHIRFRGQVPARALERVRLARLWPATSSGEAAGHRGDRSF